nr:reticulocyte-binding protein PFD0110w-like [Onthophagus taurus]
MDTKKRVEKWAKSMGYTGNVPNCFKNVCGPETIHIWEQLVSKIKPKDEIDHIRRNIIIHELNGNLPEHSMGRCKEIEIYKKKNELKAKKFKLKDEVSEKIENLENFKVNLDYKRAQNEKLKEQIRENKRKEFLYTQKRIDFEKNIKVMEQKLDFFENNHKNLKNGDKKEIVEVLNKLSNKINLKKQSSLTTSLIFNETITKSSFTFEQSQFLELHIDKTNLNQKIDVLNNKNFMDEVKKIISKHDFNKTISFLTNLINETKIKTIEIVSNQSCNKLELIKSRRRIKTLDFVYSDDIKNRLMILKCNKEINKQRDDFEKKLGDIYDQFLCLNLSQNEISSMRDLIELKLKEIETSTALETLQSELKKLDNPNGFNLESVELKLASFEKKLSDYDKKLNQIVLLSEDIDESIKNTQRETKFLFSALQRLSLETASMSFLLEKGLNKKEIETFNDYDLVYNRKVNLNRGSVFVRGLLNVEIDDFKKLRGTLNNIYAPPEMIILELIRNKIVLNNSNAMLCADKELKYEKYLLNQLEEQQIGINRVLNDLEIVYKQNTSIPKNIISQQEKIMKFWLEMPIDKFVDSKLLFNEKNFEYYKRLYDNYYKKL